MTLTLEQPRTAAPRGDDDEALLDALRAGDEAAFTTLVDRHHAAMVRVARAYVPSVAVAEEVVQETWLGVIAGIERFEGRSSVKTWLYRILLNRARTRGPRERRSVPFSSLAHEADGPSVDADRFHPPGTASAGAWSAAPRAWEDPHRRLASLETRELVREALTMLPPAQRLVVTLRDVEGLSSEETCELLGVSQGNQRVLLHRGRSKLRQVLEDQFS